MRILTALTLAVSLCLPAGAIAAFEGPGTTPAITTVEQAKNAPDDALCQIKGNIVEKVTGEREKYLFQDATGKITVEIDHKIFAGRKVTPENVVIISGKVDKDMMKDNEIDVKQFEIEK